MLVNTERRYYERTDRIDNMRTMRLPLQMCGTRMSANCTANRSRR